MGPQDLLGNGLGQRVGIKQKNETDQNYYLKCFAGFWDENDMIRLLVTKYSLVISSSPLKPGHFGLTHCGGGWTRSRILQKGIQVIQTDVCSCLLESQRQGGYAFLLIVCGQNSGIPAQL